MAKRHYEENECVSSLRKHPFVKIDTVSKTIQYSHEFVGIKTHGKIDCLVHYHRYHAVKTLISSPVKEHVQKSAIADTNKKVVKKLRMTDMVKMDIKIPKKK